MNSTGVEAGTVVGGKYEVERLLGQGGMGAVYVVRHNATHKRLALKQLLPEVEGRTYVDRFLREARAAGQIQHRHVVDIFDVGEDETGMYMVMELLEGKTLSDLLQDESLTLQELLLVMSRAMEGVAAAHACGVIHRDLKPDNIFVCPGLSGRLDDPRVLDFGISKSQADPNLTESGAMLGTPYYMSPEQVYARRDVDGRVDVYAMGVILYEAIAGRRPFEAEHISALAVKIATTEAEPLWELRPDIPRALCDVVHRALARERDERYATMDDLAAAIQPFIPRTSGFTIPADQATPLRTPRVDSPVTPPQASAASERAPSTLRDSPRSARWKWAAASVLALLLVGVAWLLQARGEPGAEPVAEPAPQPQPPPAEPASVEVTGEAQEPPQAEPADLPGGKAPPEDETLPEPPPVEGSPGEAAQPPAQEPSASAARRARQQRRERRPRTRAAARVQPSSPEAEASEPPAAEPAAEPNQAHGRAGTLGVDDF